jgi:hypothetical protein
MLHESLVTIIKRPGEWLVLGNLREELHIVFRAVFWVILPCRMIVDRRFRGAYCLHHRRVE